MKIISPRLNRLLLLLLQQQQPVSVDTLAKTLGISRRTVFREFESVDTLLRPYKLEIGTKVGEGLQLVGSSEAKEKLAAELSGNKKNRPNDKEERRLCLVLLLLNSSDIQKLYYYSNLLGVSEATISHDLDVLEPVMIKYGISLERKPGQGVVACGKEEDIRYALVAQIMQTGQHSRRLSYEYGYPPPDIQQNVEQLLSGKMAPKLDWMTEDSQNMLALLLMVGIDRFRSHHHLSDAYDFSTGFPRQMAVVLAGELEQIFDIRLPEVEREYIAGGVQAARAKQQSPLGSNEAAAFNRIQSIAFRMIERFDMPMSASLKMNDQLVQGLSLHLWSAVARLQRQLELADPLGHQLMQDYPELYLKCSRAAKVLTEEFGFIVPQSEISLLAAHFGAAVLHIGERTTRKRKLHVGIVCVAGIGVAYMMASQVRHHFKGELEAVISDWNGETDWEHADFLISTIPLPSSNRTVVLVNPLLKEEDYTKVRKEIDRQAFVHVEKPKSNFANTLTTKLTEADSCIKNARALLEGFTTLSIHADCTFEQLVKFVGYRFGKDAESGHQIYDGLMAREALSTQVITDLGIVLLHGRTEGVNTPVVSLVVPEGNLFKNKHFFNSASCIVMLIPKHAGNNLSEMMGSISSALIEDESFLASVLAGNSTVAYTRLEAILNDYISRFMEERLKG
ncbi:PRD domain-containing protein [Hydrogenoanaerobacterium sp.]|uniref:BglG family transcription antiterminator n=1 Tax=Hydrogenoanaerobacterium sp. TaxID=2953763 RepID=UPI00289F7B5E|nr:PRD domain-containing protein [Hydrogenoanaerobacterium sp.]